MEFILKHSRILLEIYPKDEARSTLVDFNDNSEFVEIVKIIMDENDDLNGCELNFFVEKINNLSNEYVETLKNHLIDLYGQTVCDEFNNNFVSSHTFKFKEFFSKYNIDDTHTEVVAKIVSINFVLNYIRNHVKNKDNMNIVIFETKK